MGCANPEFSRHPELVRAKAANSPGSSAPLFDMHRSAIAELAGVAGVEERVEALRADDTTQLYRAISDALAINETSFFRDSATFQMIRDIVLPRLIERRRPQQRLRIWSAACSTGQEPYSVAMLLRDSFPELSAWDIQILGTDISRLAIEYAERGWYRPAEIGRGITPSLMGRYLHREGDTWEMDAGVRSLCAFQQADLCAPVPPLLRFDLILMRNVLLYLPPSYRGSVLAQAHRQLRPDGFLLLGSTEQAEDSTDLFKAEKQGESYSYSPVDVPAATLEPYTGCRANDGARNLQSGSNSAEEIRTGAVADRAA